jgi:four helix bundle protein
MRPHDKLDVWRKAVEFVIEVYKATERFPREEKFGLTSQVRRAAFSIPTNIAEGAARRSSREFVYFLSNAQGSASEVETELLIANRLGYLGDSTFSELRSSHDDIGRMLIGLIRHVNRKITWYTVSGSRFPVHDYDSRFTINGSGSRFPVPGSYRVGIGIRGRRGCGATGSSSSILARTSL